MTRGNHVLRKGELAVVYVALLAPIGGMALLFAMSALESWQERTPRD